MTLNTTLSHRDFHIQAQTDPTLVLSISLIGQRGKHFAQGINAYFRMLFGANEEDVHFHHTDFDFSKGIDAVEEYTAQILSVLPVLRV